MHMFTKSLTPAGSHISRVGKGKPVLGNPGKGSSLKALLRSLFPLHSGYRSPGPVYQLRVGGDML